MDFNYHLIVVLYENFVFRDKQKFDLNLASVIICIHYGELRIQLV